MIHFVGLVIFTRKPQINKINSFLPQHCSTTCLRLLSFIRTIPCFTSNTFWSISASVVLKLTVLFEKVWIFIPVQVSWTAALCEVTELWRCGIPGLAPNDVSIRHPLTYFWGIPCSLGVIFTITNLTWTLKNCSQSSLLKEIYDVPMKFASKLIPPRVSRN